jgi:hypothetical protein
VSIFSKALHGIGHLAEKAAPYVGLIPGVGTLAGGVIGGLGGLAAGDGLGGALKYGLEGAAGGYGGAALRGLSKGGQALAVGTAALKGGVPSAPSGGPPVDANGVPQVMRNGLPSSVGDLIGTTASGDISEGGGGSVPSTFPSTPGPTGSPSSTNPWLLGLAGLEGANSAYLGKKANDYSQGALKSVQGAYNDRAPLRAAALKGLTNPTAPDTSQLKSIAARNPYAVPA